MKIKRLNLYLASLATAVGISIAGGNPVVSYAEEEEILYEVTDENVTDIIEEDYVKPTPTPEPEKRYFNDEDEYIDERNWSKEIDKDPKAGDSIPDDVPTEKEKKKIVPKETPVPDKNIPKTGNKTSPYTFGLLGGLAIGLIVQEIAKIKKAVSKAKEMNEVEKKVR